MLKSLAAGYEPGANFYRHLSGAEGESLQFRRRGPLHLDHSRFAGEEVNLAVDEMNELAAAGIEDGFDLRHVESATPIFGTAQWTAKVGPTTLVARGVISSIITRGGRIFDFAKVVEPLDLASPSPDDFEEGLRLIRLHRKPARCSAPRGKHGRHLQPGRKMAVHQSPVPGRDAVGTWEGDFWAAAAGRRGGVPAVTLGASCR